MRKKYNQLRICIEDILKFHDSEMDRLIPAENGRIIKHITEKILSVFNTPEDAVQCANQIHKYRVDLVVT